jgi:hypothetical protein
MLHQPLRQETPAAGHKTKNYRRSADFRGLTNRKRRHINANVIGPIWPK